MTQQTKASNLAIYFSLFAMVLSIFLDVFIPHHGKSPTTGYEILFMGTIWGWTSPSGWAVYANYFYAYVVFSLLSNDKRKPFTAITIMCLLAMLTPIAVRLPPVSEDFMSWGWGAFVWGVSISILAITGMFRQFFQRSHIASLALIVSMCLLFLVPPYLKGLRQYQQANIQEREHYLGNNVAYTTFEFSGIDYVPLPNSLKFNRESNIELIGENVNKGWHAYNTAELGVRKPEIYIFQDKKYSFIGVGSHVTDAPKTDYYYKLTYPKKGQTQIEILDKNKKLIWRAIQVKHGFPKYDKELFDLLMPLRNYPSPQHDNDNEVLTNRCELGFLPKSEFYGSRQHIRWQGQEIIAFNDDFEWQTQGFCGEVFDAIVSIKSWENKTQKRMEYEFKVTVFDSEKFLSIWYLDEFDENNKKQKQIATQLGEHYQKTQTLNDVIKKIDLQHDNEGNPYASVYTDFGTLKLFE